MCVSAQTRAVRVCALEHVRVRVWCVKKAMLGCTAPHHTSHAPASCPSCCCAGIRIMPSRVGRWRAPGAQTRAWRISWRAGSGASPPCATSPSASARCVRALPTLLHATPSFRQGNLAICKCGVWAELRLTLASLPAPLPLLLGVDACRPAVRCLQCDACRPAVRGSGCDLAGKRDRLLLSVLIVIWPWLGGFAALAGCFTALTVCQAKHVCTATQCQAKHARTTARCDCPQSSVLVPWTLHIHGLRARAA